MILSTEKTFKLYLDKLIQQLDANVMMADVWIDFLHADEPLVDHQTFLQTQQTRSLTPLKTFQSLFLKAIEGEVSFSLSSYVTLGIKHIDLKTYTTNPYYLAVKPSPTFNKNWEITYDHYLPYQGFLYGDVKVLPNSYFQEITPIGFSDNHFSYLAIKQDDVTWMSVTPFEIETMQPILDTLKGHVVALGLGLGYFAFMAALKPEVSHVTIIEKDDKAITLFQDHLFPFFPHKDKITVIHQDALEYLKTPKANVDHIFVDIYHTAEDGLPLYMKIKPYELKWNHTSWSYWLESSILARYRRLMLVVLDQVMHSKSKPTFTEYDRVLRLQLSLIYKKYEGINLHTIEDVNLWLSDRSIRESFLQ